MTLSPETAAASPERRAALAATCRDLARQGLVVGTAGNVSERCGDLLLVTATGARFEELTAEQVTVVDLDGAVVAGDLAPTSELDLHLRVSRDLGAGAVVHTHSPMATALSCVVDEVPCVHYSMLLLGGAVPVAPYATFGTPELAAAVVTALHGRRGVLMANHGAVTYATTLAEAVELAVLLEWCCGVYSHAAALGTPRQLDAAQQQAVVEAAVIRSYGSTRPAVPQEQT